MSSTKIEVLQLIPSLQSNEDAVDTSFNNSLASHQQNGGVTLDSWWATIYQQIRVLQPNRMLFLSAARLPTSTNTTRPPPLPLTPTPSPRYNLWMLDVALLDAVEAKRQEISGLKAAVLVLPQGRETEWQFRSMVGCAEIANQHAFSRVIFVALVRGQKFDGLDQVQQELMPLLRLLGPDNLAGPMPIVSLGSDVGVRREVFRVSSSPSSSSENGSSSSSVCHKVQSDVVVEDVLVGEHVHRRLIFEGTDLVQSEARLNVNANFLTMNAAQRKAKNKKQKAAAKKKAAQGNAAPGAATRTSPAENEVDENEPNGDEEEQLASATSSVSLDGNNAIPTSSPSSNLVQYNYLPCEYQHGILAVMSLLSTPPSSTVLIGLGGGSLAMFLHLAFQHPSLDTPSTMMMQLHVVEFQQSVVECANRFFGFHAIHKNKMVLHVEDGLVFTAGAASATSSSSSTAQQHDLFIVDVNNIDLGEGLSFPPPAFLTKEYLLQVKSLLTKKGLFVFNLGCRNEVLREQILHDVRSVFPQVCVLKPDEAYVNYIVVARAKEEPIVHEACVQQLQSFRLNSNKLAGFTWDAGMVEECEHMLKRLQGVQLYASATTQSASSSKTVQLLSLFPKEPVG